MMASGHHGKDGGWGGSNGRNTRGKRHGLKYAHNLTHTFDQNGSCSRVKDQTLVF